MKKLTACSDHNNTILKMRRLQYSATDEQNLQYPTSKIDKKNLIKNR